jgi:hypothetical protein
VNDREKMKKDEHMSAYADAGPQLEAMIPVWEDADHWRRKQAAIEAARVQALRQAQAKQEADSTSWGKVIGLYFSPLNRAAKRFAYRNAPSRD